MRNTTLERLDNNQHYCKENCIWATHFTQSRNKRSNVMINYQGEIICLMDFAVRTNTKPDTIYGRYYRGWTEDEIIKGEKDKPYRSKKIYVNFNGKKSSLKEVAQELGVTTSTIDYKYRKGILKKW